MYESGVKVEESLLKTEVAIQTGGRDINGRLIITFPASTVGQLSELGSAGLVQILRYYLSVCESSDRQQGFTFVADLQLSSQESNQVLVEALDFLQSEKRGNVSNLFVLKPKSRTRSKYLKKQLGLKESKKNPKVSTFPATILKSVSELYSRIDRTQLTEDLGGSLQHNQLAWIQFHHMIDPLMEAITKRQTILPGARDRVQLLQDYDTAGLTSYQLQALVIELEDKYHGIMRELDLENTIDWCKKMVQRLEKPDDEVALSKVSPHLLTSTITVLKKASTELVQGREEMSTIWKDTENHFQKLNQLFHFKRETTSLCDEIARFWLPKVDQPANIGSTLSQAEMYRTYFITSLYDPAKVLVGKATELLQGIHQLHQETPSLESELDFVPDLSQLIQTFTEKLERLHNTYMAIHIFYLMFEKLAQWYQKVLRFIPSTLGSQVDKAKKHGKSSIPVLPKWAQAVRSFLNKHPGPRNEHISTIEYPVSILPDAQLCSQARLLAHRIRGLNKLLTSTQQFSVTDIASAMSWKRRSLEGNDDIVIPSQIDAPHNKSYNTDRDLDREVAEIACDNERKEDASLDPHQRPATALGIVDKKTQSVTFADEIQSAREVKPSQRELSKSSQDLSEQTLQDHFTDEGMRPASSFDILPDNGTSSLRVKGERFVSLSYTSQLQSISTRNIHGTLPKSNRFRLPPSELEKIFQPPPPTNFVSNTGTVVEQLQQIMNSGLTADEKLQHAQLVLQASSSQQPPPSPFFLGGNLSNPRYSFQAERTDSDVTKFYDLSPRTNLSADWNKLSKRHQSGTITKSMPNLEEAANGQNSRIPPMYSLAAALNGHQSESNGAQSSQNTQDREVKSAREVRSAQRVGDWVEQHARALHRHDQNLDADAETDDGYSDGSRPGDRPRRRPRKQRVERKKDSDLTTNSQYEDLLDASRHQEEVETSLRRAQKILEDEEFILNERKAKYLADPDVSVDRRDSELNSGMSLDESTELPDSPGLSLDSSKSDRTVPSVSTDRGYGSSHTQSNQTSRKSQEKNIPGTKHESIQRSVSSDSSSTLTSLDPSPTPESTGYRPFIGSSKTERSSPLLSKERRKSILRQPVMSPLSTPLSSEPSHRPKISTHMPVIRGPNVHSLKPSKSLQDLLSIDEDEHDPVKLRQPVTKNRRPRGSRRLSLITFSPNQTSSSTYNEPLSAHNRRLSMETIVEVPKQEESIFKDHIDLRAQRRRRKRSDLKLGKTKNGLSASGDFSSTGNLSKSVDADSSTSQSESRSHGIKQRQSSGSETDRASNSDKQAAWDWNTKPGPTFNLVDSFRHKFSHPINNSECTNDSGRVSGKNSPMNSSVEFLNDVSLANGDKSEADVIADTQNRDKTDDTDEDIKKLNVLDDNNVSKLQKKIRLRRDAPCTRSNGPSYTMRGTRGSLVSSLPKHYIRKNSKVFDGFNSEPDGDCSPSRSSKSATIASAAGHRLLADDAWSLYR